MQCTEVGTESLSENLPYSFVRKKNCPATRVYEICWVKPGGSVCTLQNNCNKAARHLRMPQTFVIMIKNTPGLK